MHAILNAQEIILCGADRVSGALGKDLSIMDYTPKTILHIKSRASTMSPKMRLIADCVCRHPEFIVNRKVREIAKTCKCDNAQIVRFCQRLGYDGISGLRAELTREMMPALFGENEIVAPFDEMKRDFAADYVKSVNDTVGMLDRELVKKTTLTIRSAKRIVTAGCGSSGLAAREMQVKLFRMGFNAANTSDASFSLLNCALLGRGDVLIAFSVSGESRMVCDLAEKAKSQKANVIVVTHHPTSPLGKLGDIVLQSCSPQDTTQVGAMNSSVAQAVIVHFIALMIAASDESGSIESSTDLVNQLLHPAPANVPR